MAGPGSAHAALPGWKIDVDEVSGGHGGFTATPPATGASALQVRWQDGKDTEDSWQSVYVTLGNASFYSGWDWGRDSMSDGYRIDVAGVGSGEKMTSGYRGGGGRSAASISPELAAAFWRVFEDAGVTLDQLVAVLGARLPSEVHSRCEIDNRLRELASDAKKAGEPPIARA